MRWPGHFRVGFLCLLSFRFVSKKENLQCCGDVSDILITSKGAWAFLCFVTFRNFNFNRSLNRRQMHCKNNRMNNRGMDGQTSAMQSKHKHN